jgi:predicted CoA-binding protein
MARVAVIGASPKSERYSNRALRMLREAGHTPLPVSRLGEEILGLAGYAAVDLIPDPVDTVTIYLSPEKQPPVIRGILARRPRRVIFNPGAENPGVYPRLSAAGIEVVEACTLVLLSTGQF